MSDRQDLIWERATELLSRAPTWHELHRELASEGLDEHLGPGGMQQVLQLWHETSARRLSDADLARELEFWSGGGTYTSHLKGFQAVPPEVLVAEAEHRDWFIKITPSRKALINPPEGRPFTIQLTAV